MHDFDRKWKRMERQGRVIRFFAFAWMAFVALLIIGALGITIYFVTTTNPSELAHDLGGLVGDFQKGMNE